MKPLVGKLGVEIYESWYRDFPKGLDLIDRGIKTIHSCLLLCSEQLVRPSESRAGSDIFKGQVPDICLVTWLWLLMEAYDRVTASRLLLLTGHSNRCLASLRDAVECLQGAHLCLSESKEAARWHKGKKLRKPKDFRYPHEIDERITDKLQHDFNTAGTHGYFRAAAFTLLGAAHIRDADLDDASRVVFLNNMRLSFISQVLLVCWIFLTYLIRIGEGLVSQETELKSTYLDIFIWLEPGLLELGLIQNTPIGGKSK